MCLLHWIMKFDIQNFSILNIYQDSVLQLYIFSSDKSTYMVSALILDSVLHHLDKAFKLYDFCHSYPH